MFVIESYIARKITPWNRKIISLLRLAGFRKAHKWACWLAESWKMSEGGHIIIWDSHFKKDIIILEIEMIINTCFVSLKKLGNKRFPFPLISLTKSNKTPVIILDLIWKS